MIDYKLMSALTILTILMLLIVVATISRSNKEINKLSGKLFDLTTKFHKITDDKFKDLI